MNVLVRYVDIVINFITHGYLVRVGAIAMKGAGITRKYVSIAFHK